MGADVAAGLETRSRPWMTWTLVLSCVISFAYTHGLESKVRAGSDAALARAMDYFHGHSYLEQPALLHGTLGQSDTDEHHAGREGDRRIESRIPEPVKRRHQQTLDGLVVDAFAPYAELPKYRLGLRATERTPSRWISYALLHDGWFHLIGNSLLLLLLGTFLERAWRSALLGGFVIVAALVSGWTFCVANPQLVDPLIGTVGIVAALLGAFSVRFASAWRQPSYALLLMAGIGWLIAPAYLGWEPSIARMLTAAAATSGFGPSFGAVVGGLGVGLVSAIAVMMAGIERKLPQPTIILDAEQTGDVLDRARDAHSDGRSEEAQALVASLLRTQPNHRDALLATWEIGIDLGGREEAASAMTRLVELEIRHGEQEGAIEHWSKLVEHRLESRVQPNLLIRIALLLSTAGRKEDAVHAFESALRGARGSDAAAVAARVARAARDIDPAIAEDAAWRALSELELAIEERQGLEALIAQLGTRTGDAAARIEKGCSVDASGGRDDEELIDYSFNGSLSEPMSETSSEAIAPSVDDSDVDKTESASPLVQWEDAELSDDASELDESLQIVADDDTPVVAAGRNDASHPTPIALDLTARELEVLDCVPTGLTEAGLDVEVGGVKKRILYDRMQAISVVAIADGDTKPVLVVDLILNWNDGSENELKAIRLSSDGFDPRRLVSGDKAAIDAMRELIDQLLTRSGATPLPDLDAARGYPFVSFTDIGSYEHGILSVEPAE